MAESKWVPITGVDAVFSVALWHLLADLNQAAAELNRVLKPGGSFAIITANPNAYNLWLSNYKAKRTEGIKVIGSVLRSDGSTEEDIIWMHSLEAIIESLENAGLIVSQKQSFRKADDSSNFFIMIQGKANQMDKPKTKPTSELKEGTDYYIDDNGLLVFTKEYLLQRGYCCGNGCRNCPYDKE